MITKLIFISLLIILIKEIIRYQKSLNKLNKTISSYKKEYMEELTFKMIGDTLYQRYIIY